MEEIKIGDLFVERDSRGFYLRQMIGEQDNCWKAKVLFAFGQYVQDGNGTYNTGDYHRFKKERIDYWIWI